MDYHRSLPKGLCCSRFLLMPERDEGLIIKFAENPNLRREPNALEEKEKIQKDKHRLEQWAKRNRMRGI